MLRAGSAPASSPTARGGSGSPSCRRDATGVTARRIGFETLAREDVAPDSPPLRFALPDKPDFAEDLPAAYWYAQLEWPDARVARQLRPGLRQLPPDRRLGLAHAAGQGGVGGSAGTDGATRSAAVRAQPRGADRQADRDLRSRGAQTCLRAAGGAVRRRTARGHPRIRDRPRAQHELPRPGAGRGRAPVHGRGVLAGPAHAGPRSVPHRPGRPLHRAGR